MSFGLQFSLEKRILIDSCIVDEILLLLARAKPAQPISSL